MDFGESFGVFAAGDGGWETGKLKTWETEILKIPEAGKRDFFHLSLLADVCQKIPVTICPRSGEAYVAL